MTQRPPRSTRTDTLVPYTTLVRSPAASTMANADRNRGEFLPVMSPVSPRLQNHDCGHNIQRRPEMQLRCFWSRPHDAFSNCRRNHDRSEEHTSELQSLMRISYAVFCLKKKIILNEGSILLLLEST